MIAVGIDYSHLEVILLARQDIERSDPFFGMQGCLAIIKGS